MSALPLDETENLRRLDEALASLLEAARDRPVVLADGDRTLTAIDTSRVFLDRAGVDHLPVKRRFQRDGYCFAAFRYHAEVHLALDDATHARAAAEVAAEVALHPGASAFLARACERAAVFVVSAGVPRIWRGILDREGLGDIAVIGGIDPAFPYVFGRAEKGHACARFRRVAPVVVALGDSDVDTEMMLAADHAVVVVNHRRNEDLLPHLGSHRSLRQIAPAGDAHAGIPQIAFADVLGLLEPRAAGQITEVPCR